MHSPRSMKRLALVLTLQAGATAVQAGSLDLTIHDYGVSFGDSRVTHGVRINAVDSEVRRVDGLNITLWKPESNLHSAVNGVAVGLVAGAAETMRGIALGGVGVACDDGWGIAAGVLGVGGDGFTGIMLGGLGVGADRASGIALGGL